METIDVNANLRDKVGKGSARFARKNGLVPGVIYGNKEKALPISLSAKEWESLVQKPGIYGQLLSILVNNEKYFVLPRDIQFHPVSEKTISAKFFAAVYTDLTIGILANSFSPKVTKVLPT